MLKVSLLAGQGGMTRVKPQDICQLCQAPPSNTRLQLTIGSMTCTSHRVQVIHLALGSRWPALEYSYLQATSISCCPASPDTPPHFSQLHEHTAMGK